MKKWITIILLAVFLSLVGVKVYLKILEQGGGYKRRQKRKTSCSGTGKGQAHDDQGH